MRSLAVISSRTAATFVLALLVTARAPARAQTLPPSITLPVKPPSEVNMENYGHAEVKVSDGNEVVMNGRHWWARLDLSGLAGDERAK